MLNEAERYRDTTHGLRQQKQKIKEHFSKTKRKPFSNRSVAMVTNFWRQITEIASSARL